MRITIFLAAALSAALLDAPARAQEHEHHSSTPATPADHAGHAMPIEDHSAHQAMPGMSMPGMSMPDMSMPGMSMSGMPMTGILGAYPMSRDASGTAWQPDQAPHGGLHAMAGSWSLMGHLSLSGIYSDQTGPRGDDKLFPAGMVMGAARRELSDLDTLNLRLMLSPDPFMGRRGYPLLFASGETADGVDHLVDRQHPHDLVMEMAGSLSHRFTDADSAFVYFGYPGEPALGPPAFMHRASAIANPAAPISHHWLDSTHITFGVATAGFVHENWKMEVSQFTGREPDQHRFNFDEPRFDSTAVRLSYNPDDHWSLQASWGHLNSPEQLNPDEDETRITASAQYFARLQGDSSISAMLAWGLKDLSDGAKLNAAIFETTFKPSDPWSLFTRFEWQENAELGIGHAVSRVSQFSLGAVHDWRLADNWKLGLGAMHTFDIAPADLGYGASPRGVMGFVRIVAE